MSDPATQEWLRRVEAELGSALSALAAAQDEAKAHDNCAWRRLAIAARAERDEAQAALADYLRKETTHD